MTSLIVVIVVVIAIFAVIGKLSTKNSKQQPAPIKPKRILTLNEQPTFNRLREALPQHIILAQVAFSALITTKDYATRNRFNRKIADFVVLDKAYNVIAVVELDDSSHNGREQEDANRDAMLHEAGYKVIRYKRTPNYEQVIADFC